MCGVSDYGRDSFVFRHGKEQNFTTYTITYLVMWDILWFYIEVFFVQEDRLDTAELPS